MRFVLRVSAARDRAEFCAVVNASQTSTKGARIRVFHTRRYRALDTCGCAEYRADCLGTLGGDAEGLNLRLHDARAVRSMAMGAKRWPREALMLRSAISGGGS